MRDDPVAESKGLLYFTDGSLAYAGRYSHQDTFDAHTHSFVEIAVVLGGQGNHHTMTGDTPLTRGDVVLLRPGTWHGYTECRDLELFNCCFSAELLTRELAWTQEDPIISYLLSTGPYSMHRRGMLTAHLDEPALEEALVHLDGLDDLRRRPLTQHRADVIGRLSLFLGNLARAVAEANFVTSAGPTHPAVVQAMRALESRVAHDWTLVELADRLHLTSSYLVRLFKSETGLPPMAYLARQRVEAAADLLLHTDDSVSVIGELVGWNDQNYFARRFKAHFGLSPSAYRKRFTTRSAQLSPPE
ncbi:AraC family transcriptional regulator [Actinocorallia longicatena]|uniref:HTH araC/xylS-type domain-containing protein n=1 Tax=Actinocorallia longicatena TaxID=111803 RepID=A0ABP6Q0A7_9ACTN